MVSTVALIVYSMNGCVPVDPLVKNAEPIVSIRTVSAVKEGESVELNGSDSFDPDGDTITCRWVLLQGPESATLEDESALVTRFVPSVQGMYRFQLVVDDGKNVSSSNIDIEVLAADDPDPTKMAAPQFNPVDGTKFQGSLNVAISCRTQNAKIYYTLDDSIPSAENGTEYTGGITLTKSTRVKAIALGEGMEPSVVAEASYVNEASVAMPVIDPEDGTVFQNTLQVTISSDTEGAVIYYSIDGTIPTPEIGTLYSGPITIGDSTSLKAVAFKDGMIESQPASAVYTKQGTTAPVTVSPSTGEIFSTTLDVILACETPDAKIYYTLDGSEPNASTGLLYAGPINLTQTATIKAISCKEGLYDGPVIESQFIQQGIVPNPEFLPNGQTQYQDSLNVELTCAVSDAIIVYTTDGKKPTRTYGQVYTGPITITTNKTIKAFAYRDGMYDSGIVTAGYVRLYPVGNPVFSVRSGLSFADTLDVTISSATSGATIRYTTDGTEPSRTNGKTYSGAIHLTSTTTLKAMGYKNYMIDSSVVSATYPRVPGGTQKWAYGTANYIDSSAGIADDGTIYVGSYDQKLYAINPNGTTRWVFPTGGIVFSSPAISRDGTVHVGSINGKLYAVYPDGTLKWVYDTGRAIVSSPAIGPDGSIHIHIDGKVIAVRPNGSLKWESSTTVLGNYNYSSPVIGSDGTIYVGSVDKKIYAIASNGTKKWTFQTGNYIDCSAAIGSDGTIYMGSGDKKLYALNPNGTLKWSYTTGGYIDSSPAIGADGTIYIGSADNKLYAISSTGTLKWTFSTYGPIHATAAIRNDGVIYIPSTDGNLYAVGSNGSKKWSFAMGYVIDASPSIGEDGTIYIGSKDCKIYAIDGPGCLANTPWPKFQKNTRQSGSMSEP
jgi:outer membrane protein assembly factor BamB